MSEPTKPAIYVRRSCPFCLKVKLFLLEAGLMDAVAIHEFEPGSQQEDDIRAELAKKLDTVSFPAAQLEPGRYLTESDAIIALLAARAGRDPADMPVLTSYVEGALKPMMALWKENFELKATAA
ncbi:glutathione S-transferase N-terminal domain-containing protein [Rhizobium hainanense]|uniref:Glutathione S-transferase, N-terminal domain n=1 Tax=Rhizobium hainanense TaxID=52131 RepID=A0A1C3VPP1_9HYPH|nr:glutathione S-transferase N-terminal domain-containing protein [Rhizobium hainanense]SCB29732.1 Glutathione S-transferase, N-terminal domain [Rhizobium hainanense]